ncbi:DUF2716 domain-containing protein [Nocardiopsis metallicus]|uniref:DUF2716 domain-containing protein n=1 Tax=Nocardiopsis metallicus TaxID=179819 RepID=A0A840WE65_9ACTN|nr:DUF2716 domain-containing protein [Nocardiopsis metallicus]MBB5490255.1 hypothetical protein [Nocardiopsis metallicus]
MPCPLDPLLAATMHVLRHAYDTYLRGHLPVPPKAGAVHLQDPYLTSARLVRSHFGTHGSVDHGPLPPETDLSALVARQQERFEAHTEPARWPVHAHDPPALAPALHAAGFVPGPERSVLVAELADIPSAHLAAEERLRENDRVTSSAVRQLATASGPHRRSLVEHESDGTTFEHRTLALVHRAQVRAASWAVLRTGTPFVVLEGMTAPRPTFLWEWAHRAGTVRPKSGWWVWDQAQARLMAAEVDPQAQPDLYEMLLDSGFHEITTVRTHTWEPSGAPATSRPVTELFDGPEHDDIWDRFTSRFFFAPSTTLFPGIVEPAASVTWSLHRADEDPEHRTELDRTVRQGLAASVPEGESLYTLDWQHIGHRYDPRRVGGPEQPRNPAFAFPNGDYYINLTKDLRLGTFGHPWEEGPHGQGTLCVFGTELLARVEDRLTRLLGPPIRRSGRPVR